MVYHFDSKVTRQQVIFVQRTILTKHENMDDLQTIGNNKQLDSDKTLVRVHSFYTRVDLCTPYGNLTLRSVTLAFTLFPLLIDPWHKQLHCTLRLKTT